MFGKTVRNPSVKEQIKQELIDTILKRTQDQSKSYTGRPFKGYSKLYKSSDDFQAFGKTNKVNLTLTGDMLASLDAIEETNNTITFGFLDADEQAKAHGHITGGGKLPKRDFFGFSNKEIDEIRAKFEGEIESREVSFEESLILGELRELLRGQSEG